MTTIGFLERPTTFSLTSLQSCLLSSFSLLSPDGLQLERLRVRTSLSEHRCFIANTNYGLDPSTSDGDPMHQPRVL